MFLIHSAGEALAYSNFFGYFASTQREISR